ACPRMVRCPRSHARRTRKEGEALQPRLTGARTAPNQPGTSPTRTLRAARLALLVLPLLAAASASAAGADAVGTVIPPDGLFLRSGPGTQHTALELLPGGTRVGLTGPVADGWYPAVYKGKRGFLRAEFVEAPADAGTTPRKATVRSADGLALREEPHV